MIALRRPFLFLILLLLVRLINSPAMLIISFPVMLKTVFFLMFLNHLVCMLMLPLLVLMIIMLLLMLLFLPAMLLIICRLLFVSFIVMILPLSWLRSKLELWIRPFTQILV